MPFTEFDDDNCFASMKTNGYTGQERSTKDCSKGKIHVLYNFIYSTDDPIVATIA
jgi:hypothetical protein